MVTIAAGLPSLTRITMVELSGSAISLDGTPISTVHLYDFQAGFSRTLGSVTTVSNGSFSLTTHTRISLAALNTFTASATDAAGKFGANAGLFRLRSAASDVLSGTSGQSDVFATFLRPAKTPSTVSKRRAPSAQRTT